MTRAYRIEVAWDEDDQVWVADVPDLPLCTAHGPTPHDAVAEAELAVEAWIEAAQGTGRDIPKPSRRRANA